MNVIETPNLQRNLRLTIELMEFSALMVVALNIADEARATGLRVDAGKLGEMLGVRMLPTIGRRRLRRRRRWRSCCCSFYITRDNSCLAVYGVMAKELGARFVNTFMVYCFVVGWVAGFAAYRIGVWAT